MEQAPADDNPDGPSAEADFDIEGPDGDGFVWVCSKAGRHEWCHNLGQYQAVATKWADWLGQRDFGEWPRLAR